MSPIPIIFIDSSDAFRRLVTRLLARHFAEDITLVGEHDTWPTIITPGIQPRVVLLGLGAEGMLELQQIVDIRATLPDVPVLVLSHLADAAYREAALDAGAADFVAKEALAIALVPALRQLINPSAESPADRASANGNQTGIAPSSEEIGP